VLNLKNQVVSLTGEEQQWRRNIVWIRWVGCNSTGELATKMIYEKEGRSMVRRQTCRDRNAFPSAHCDPSVSTSRVRPPPGQKLQLPSLQYTTAKLLQNLDRSSPAVPRQHCRATTHSSSPRMGPTCGPAIPREQGLQPHNSIIP